MNHGVLRMSITRSAEDLCRAGELRPGFQIAFFRIRTSFPPKGEMLPHWTRCMPCLAKDAFLDVGLGSVANCRGRRRRFRMHTQLPSRHSSTGVSGGKAAALSRWQ